MNIGTLFCCCFVCPQNMYIMVLKRHKMNSPNFKVYSTIHISVPVRIKWEKLWTLTNKTSIPLYEFSGSSHAVKSINFVAISRDIQNTKRKLSLSINRISYKPLRLIGCCEHQWFSQKMTVKGHNFLAFPKMSSPKIATKRHNFLSLFPDVLVSNFD